jgi:hypothetical protein
MNSTMFAPMLARVKRDRSCFTRIGKVCAAGIAALACTAAQAQVYLLQAPGGSLGLQAIAGSQDGGVVTGYYGFFGGPNSAFRWTPSTGVQAIPKVSLPNYTIGNGVSRDGLIIGGSSNDLGFRWTSGTGSTAIGPFGTGSPTEVYGLSGNGQVFFGRTRQLSGEMRAFTWTTSGPTILPQLPGGYNSQVHASTPTGNVLVGLADVSGGAKPVVWTSSGITNIAAAWPFGVSYPYGVNDAGNMIWGVGAIGVGNHAVRWRQVGPNWVADDMGVPNGYASVSFGGNTPDGNVHVGAINGPSYTTAHIWSSTVGWRTIGNFLTSVGVSMPIGTIDFLFADGVSADGTAIWGYANYNGINAENRVGWVARNIPCLQAPTLFQDPTDLILACEGDTASMGVSGGGNYTGALSYQWQKNGINISNGPTGTGATYVGVNTPNFSITNIRVGDDGYYSCIISNPCGSVSSSSTEVNVSALPYFTSLPAPAGTCVLAGSASFTMGVQNATNYQWEWQSPTSGQWFSFFNGYNADVTPGFGMSASGAGTDTLTISNVSWNYHTSIQIRMGAGNACRSLRPEETTLFRRFAPELLSGASNDYYCHSTPSVFSANLTDVQQWYWLWWDPTLNNWNGLSDGPYTTVFPSGFSAIVGGSNTGTLSFDIQTLGSVPNSLYFMAFATNDCGGAFSAVGTLTICRADFNCDGFVDFTDFDDFAGAFENAGPGADFNGDGFIDFTDFDAYVSAFELGC